MKGIILAGGEGTRLYPLTEAISKQILPVYDKPMIYYPISTLISLNISEILIISNSYNLQIYKKLLKDGSQWGINFKYAIQENANGIAESLLIAEEFSNEDDVALILGDNIFISNTLNSQSTDQFTEGAMIFTIDVSDPERYGVIQFKNDLPYKIVEKPTTFLSSKAVTGLYFFDKYAAKYAKGLTPSNRGELEITDLNNIYLGKNSLSIVDLGKNSIWLDAGTFTSLKESSEQISAMQSRSGFLLGSPEFESYKQGFISEKYLKKYLKGKPKNDYFDLLKNSIDHN